MTQLLNPIDNMNVVAAKKLITFFIVIYILRLKLFRLKRKSKYYFDKNK